MRCNVWLKVLNLIKRMCQPMSSVLVDGKYKELTSCCFKFM